MRYDVNMLNWLLSDEFAHVLGILSSICFALQYLPQAYLNFKRKSVKGFSTVGIIIKLIGASFLLLNSFLNGEVASVVFYVLINVVQHSVFILQFERQGIQQLQNFLLHLVLFDLQEAQNHIFQYLWLQIQNLEGC